MRINKKAATVAVAAVTLAGSGIAYAYWSTTGGGSGTATTSTGVSNTLDFTGSSTTDMAPGIADQTISGTVQNHSTSQDVHVAGVSAWISVAKLQTGSPAADVYTGTCDATDYSLQGSAGTGADTVGHAVAVTGFTPVELLKNNGNTGTFSVTLGFHDKSAALQDGCKGATVTVHYIAS